MAQFRAGNKWIDATDNRSTIQVPRDRREDGHHAPSVGLTRPPLTDCSTGPRRIRERQGPMPDPTTQGSTPGPDHGGEDREAELGMPSSSSTMQAGMALLLATRESLGHVMTKPLI